jgi:hypothetical protein
MQRIVGVVVANAHRTQRQGAFEQVQDFVADLALARRWSRHQ